MMSKIIANNKDQVGLILYNIVTIIYKFRIQNKIRLALIKSAQSKIYSNLPLLP
jgi:hypothetical protein